MSLRGSISKSCLLAFLLVWGASLRARADDNSFFGRSQQSEAALMGMLYDLKQTPDRKPTNIDPGYGYAHVVDNYLVHNWDESYLNQYYCVSRPLYTTQIFIPTMNADNAPRAFNAEKLVAPSRWIIHYKGQVSPPEPGTYRFWGISDDVLDAAIDGKTVLVANHEATVLPMLNWHSPEPPGSHFGDGNLVAGDWFTLKAGEIVDLDVIIGERPGGLFNCFLMIQKQGNTYGTTKDGKIKLPIFQVAPYDTPKTDDADFGPPAPTWKCYQ